MQVTTWLDEEWTPLEVHARVGEAAASAYADLRAAGKQEMGDILLGLSSELLSVEAEKRLFHDTFTGAFEVANKVRLSHAHQQTSPFMRWQSRCA